MENSDAVTRCASVRALEPTSMEPSTSLNDPQTDDLVDGRFRVVSRLGPSRAGWRWLVEQVPLGRQVELVLLDALPAHSDAALRFERAADALCRLSHPNVLQVFDRGTWQGRPYLVTELVEGQTLADVLAEGPMDPVRFTGIARQIANALGNAHDHGLVHRDVRPENIRIHQNSVDEDVIRVVDFGLVQDLAADGAEITHPGAMVGSPLYMSPEQIRGEAVDRRSDIYSFGVLLYRGFVGQLPFGEEASGATLDAQLHQAPPAFPADLYLPPAIEWTTRVCLAKAPADRFSAMTDVSQALRACAVALVDPPLWNVSLALRQGKTVVPESLADLSASWSTAYRTPAPIQRIAAPMMLGDLTPEPAPSRAIDTSMSTLRPAPQVSAPTGPIPVVVAPPPQKKPFPVVWVFGGLAFLLIGGGTAFAVASAGLFGAATLTQSAPVAEPVVAPAVVEPVAPAPVKDIAAIPAVTPPTALEASEPAPAAVPAVAAPVVAAVAPPSAKVPPPPAQKGPKPSAGSAPVSVVAAPVQAVPEAPVAIVETKAAPEVAAPPVARGPRTYHVSEVKVKKQLPFKYPEAARKLDVGDATCKVKVILDVSGSPVRIEEQVCARGFFDDARDTLMKWRWEAPLVNGAPVEAQFSMTIKYSIS